MYNFYGNYIGSFFPVEGNPSGTVLISQVEHYLNPRLRIQIAKEFVISSIHNMRKTLMHYGIETEILESAMRGAELAQDTNMQMGHEANARKFYYSKFNEIIKDDNFEFITRSRQPPSDPINAMISFGNSLIYSTCLTEIRKTALDPRISYLHEPFERRFSLNLDIAEIFKPLIVDRTIFSLINKKMLKEDDFDAESGFCFLSDAGRKKFIKEFDERLSCTIQHPKLKRSVSYRHLLRLECYKFIRHLLEGETYKGFKIYW